MSFSEYFLKRVIRGEDKKKFKPKNLYSDKDTERISREMTIFLKHKPKRKSDKNGR